METKNKIFQPKVIIGSITSFIVAAVGIIAVFFPSVFNLEKSTIKEKTMFLHAPESAGELFKFLKDNLDEIVKINILYCSGEDYKSGSFKRDGFEVFTRETFFGKPKENVITEQDKAAAALYGKDYLKTLALGAYPFYVSSEITWDGESAELEFRQNGFIEIRQSQSGYGYMIKLGEMSKDADYEWYALDMIADDEKINKTCKALKQSVALLYGTFMVNNESGDGLAIFGLDPVSRKDLKLKKY